MARLYPEEIAYRDADAGTTITFRQWDERSSALGRGLAAQGVRKGDRVALYLTSGWYLDWIVAYAAIHKAGAVAVPVNTRLIAAELGTILDHAEARPPSRAASWRPTWRPRAPSRSSAPSTARSRAPATCGAGSATTPTSRSSSRPATWPTSCTPRARPACRRASPSGTATCRDAAEPARPRGGRRVDHVVASVHVRRHRVHVQPDEDGHGRDLPGPSSMPAGGSATWEEPPHDAPSSCPRWRSCSSTHRAVGDGRSEQPGDRSRSAARHCRRRRSPPCRALARGDGVQLATG